MDAPGGGCTCSPDSLISCRTTRENKKSLPAQRQPQNFFKTKRQYFDYAKRSIFDFNGIGGQFTIEATKIDSMSKYVMSNNEIKQACSFIRQKERMLKYGKTEKL